MKLQLNIQTHTSVPNTLEGEIGETKLSNIKRTQTGNTTQQTEAKNKKE